jgi:hypothetical protein
MYLADAFYYFLKASNNLQNEYKQRKVSRILKKYERQSTKKKFEIFLFWALLLN